MNYVLLDPAAAQLFVMCIVKTNRLDMKLMRISPMLYTKQLRKTVDFYTNVLGFKCEAISEEYGWASVQKNSVTIMFAQPNEHMPFDKPTLTGSIYLYPDNVDEIWNNIKDKVTVCYPIENFDYGMREFGIMDKQWLHASIRPRNIIKK